MSSGGNDDINDNEKKLSNLRAILGADIPNARLTQVLEASNGSLEHAIAIFFNQMHHPVSKHSEGNPRGKRDESVSSETCIIDPPSHASKNARDVEIPGLETNDQNAKTIVNKKRSPRNISSPDNSEKGSTTKQARLDSFFRVNSNNPTSPFSIQKAQGSESQFDKITKGTQKSKSRFSVTSTSVLDSSLKNSSSSKATSKPVGDDDVESKAGGSKNDNHVGSDSTSFLSFQRLCETLQQITDTTKRLIKLKALETFIREIIDSKSNIGSDVSMRASALSSALELVIGGITSTPLNVSGSAVSKALQTSLGITRSQMSKAYRKHGDIGDCAACFFQKKTHFIIASNLRRLSSIQVAEVSRTMLRFNRVSFPPFLSDDLLSVYDLTAFVYSPIFRVYAKSVRQMEETQSNIYYFLSSGVVRARWNVAFWSDY